jgi:hypothetical protein
MSDSGIILLNTSSSFEKKRKENRASSALITYLNYLDTFFALIAYQVSYLTDYGRGESRRKTIKPLLELNVFIIIKTYKDRRVMLLKNVIMLRN